MASLRNLQYDGELVFPEDYEFTNEQIADAKRLSQNELEWLMMAHFATVEVTSPDWKEPPQHVYDRAGCLPNFFEEYALGWMDQ